ncbi:hypothetical protein JJQ72_16710 [Paenibacillus sp. F411]|uniref:hypothetical protein n=1 Tax=Paenibacillus sp. F411 TaxID=2820239 RepID=UPI001AAF97FA|nr:hypothetical protein [Paenibacillus sp. F411]MBO2945622.1 hypothetical protein [Paenibacillus sp. F411]
MGYTTIFAGQYKLNKPLDDKTNELLQGLARTRRMKRDPEILEDLGFGKAEIFGIEGEFFIDPEKHDPFRNCPSVVDHNEPPATQPGLWLQWVPTEDRQSLVWDKGEKFYEAGSWIIYLIERILSPKGYVVNGIVNAQGQHRDDRWRIEVKGNKVSIKCGFSRKAPIPNFSQWYEELELDYEKNCG